MGKDKTNQTAAENLNAEDITDDLNAEGSASTKASPANVSNVDNQAGSSLDNDLDTEDEAAEFVVLKGNSIRHDGKVYRENSAIPVTGEDADRLLQAGVIADISVLRERILSASPSVSVTTE